MSAVSLNPEIVRAHLRMRYGTLEKFAITRGLKSQAVRDFLRGTSSTAKAAVANELGVDPDQFQLSKDSTNVDLDSKTVARSHRQNAGGQ